MRAALSALLLVCSTALALSGSVRIEKLPPEARRTLELM